MATALAIRSLRLIGIVLLVAAPSIAIGDEVAIRRELRQIDDVWSRRTAPVDSAVISSSSIITRTWWPTPYGLTPVGAGGAIVADCSLARSARWLHPSGTLAPQLNRAR